jgi:hypothetical protein
MLCLVEFALGCGAVAEDPWWKVGAAKPENHAEYHASSSLTLRFICIAVTYMVVG